MFLRCKKRRKDGKEQLYWSVVENRRISAGRMLQRQVLYLGELNGRQEAAWRKTVDLLGEDANQPSQVASSMKNISQVWVPKERFPSWRSASQACD